VNEVFVKDIPRTDPRLGRIVVHDPASRGFVHPGNTVDKSTWRDKKIRIIDPVKNPNQTVGNCTMCSKAMQLNTVNNRAKGVVLDMAWAMETYRWETANDSFQGAYPAQDTGSSGLWASKTAQHYGVGGEYTWLFNGADGVVQALMLGDTVSIGARWENDMFQRDKDGQVHLGGGLAGGHQWTARGYWKSRDLILGRCWWGSFQDFWIARTVVDDLLHDNGDAHVQQRIGKGNTSGAPQ